MTPNDMNPKLKDKPKPEDDAGRGDDADVDLTDPSVPIDYEAPLRTEEPDRRKNSSRMNQTIETD
jgi:hypothetical protein